MHQRIQIWTPTSVSSRQCLNCITFQIGCHCPRIVGHVQVASGWFLKSVICRVENLANVPFINRVLSNSYSTVCIMKQKPALIRPMVPPPCPQVPTSPRKTPPQTIFCVNLSLYTTTNMLITLKKIGAKFLIPSRNYWMKIRRSISQQLENKIKRMC